jgi:hypothetical protein
MSDSDDTLTSEIVDSIPPPEPMTTDTDAPYGKTPDGVKLDKNGNPAPYGLKKDGTAAKQRGRRAGTGPGKSPKSTSKKSAIDYRPGVKGILQIPTGVLTGMGLASKNDMFLADAYTIGMYTDGIAEALNDLAQDNHQIAGVLDRALAAGPYSALIMAVLPMMAQLGVNHGVIPPGSARLMGSGHDPADLAAAAKADINQFEGMAEATSSNGSESYG